MYCSEINEASSVNVIVCLFVVLAFYCNAFKSDYCQTKQVFAWIIILLLRYTVFSLLFLHMRSSDHAKYADLF